jgi:hypothetical protein|tara:strand:+ start:2599 stop:3441 length:843 start_codon:yes stop_codon:yes gene_type:complete
MSIKLNSVPLLVLSLALVTGCDSEPGSTGTSGSGGEQAVAVGTQVVTEASGGFEVKLSAPEIVKGPVSMSSNFTVPVKVEVTGPADSAVFISSFDPPMSSGCTKTRTPPMKHLLDSTGKATAEGEVHYAAIIDCTFKIEVYVSDTYGRGDPEFESFGLLSETMIPLEITIPHDIPPDHPELLKRRAREQCEVAGAGVVKNDREVVEFDWNYKSVKEEPPNSYQVKGYITTTGISSTNMMFGYECAVLREEGGTWQVISAEIEGWEKYLRESEEYLRNRKG